MKTSMHKKSLDENSTSLNEEVIALDTSAKTIDLLREIIAERKKRNSRFSQRALAVKMGVSSGRLSELLNNRRPLSEYYLDCAAKALRLNQEDAKNLRRVWLLENSGKTRKMAASKIQYGTLLSQEQSNSLNNWKPYAVMSLLQTERYAQFVADHPEKSAQTEWIASSLSLAESEVVALTDLMEHLNLLHFETKFQVSYTEATTGYDIPSPNLQKCHSEDLDLAKARLEKLAVEFRDFSSITFTMDPADILKAKKMIRVFRRTFAKSMERGPKKEVFQISVQLFPISDIFKKYQ